MAIGKGLGSLIPAKNTPANVQNQAAVAKKSQAFSKEDEIAVSDISVNPHQPRQHFNHQELEDLINSIKEHGIIQPLVITKTEDGYELIAGERRLKAAKIAGLKTVPVVIRKASDLEKLELALIENIQRSDLNPVEKADGYKKLIDEFGLTQEQAAKKVGISRSAFTNILRLLKLPAEIQTALVDNKITEGHAKIILGVEGEGAQMSLYKKVISNKLSVRDLEGSVTKDPAVKKKNKRISWQDPQIASWQEELSQELKTKITIKKKGDGGSVVIDYYSPQELKGIIDKIKE